MDDKLIMLIDDSENDYKIIKRSFEKAGIENNILHMDSGDEAINYLSHKDRYIDGKKYPLPKIILLDLNMPKVHGKEILKFLKNKNILKRIPTIILTSSSDDRDIKECYDLGANSYLVKPITNEHFLKLSKAIADYWIESAVLTQDK